MNTEFTPTPEVPETPVVPETPEAPVAPEAPVMPQAPIPPQAPGEPFTYYNMPPQPQKKKPLGLIIGAIVAVILIAIISVVGYNAANADVFAVQDKIDSIGVVTAESKPLLVEIVEDYEALTPEKQEKVKNIDELYTAISTYYDIKMDELEDSQVFSTLKSLLFENMGDYSPAVYVDREERALRFDIVLPYDIYNFIVEYPGAAASSWSSLCDTFNNITETAYPYVEEYEADVIMSVYGNSSKTKLAFESTNGEITYDVLD